MIRIDFETRSTVKLGKKGGVGAPKYAAHPSTQVLCMAYQVDDAPVQIWVPGEKNCPFDPSGHLIEAHNAMFERCIWHHIMVKRRGWPKIKSSQWRCSASRAAAMALPRSLENVGLALALPKQKDAEGHAIMLKLARPRKPSKNNSAVWHWRDEDYRKLRSYCMDDVATERCLGESEDVYELSKEELFLWQLDQTINLRGFKVDIPVIEAAKRIILQWERVVTNEIRVMTNGELTSVRQIAKVVKWCGAHGFPLPNLQKRTVDNFLQTHPDLPADVSFVLRARQSLGKSSTAKLAAMLASADADGRVRDTMMFHGASTGRWAGQRSQPQNYPKNDGIDQERAIELITAQDLRGIRHEFGDPMATISRCLRGMIIAPPGKRFYGADFSKIELCVLCWLANQIDILELLRAGEDVYVRQAMQIYDCVREDVHEVERDIGKRGVLGCGYGCAWKTFREMVYKQTGLLISQRLAMDVVNGYRSMFHKVVSYWYSLNDCVMEVVKTGETKAIGQLRWGIKDNYLHCRLPSGRLLSYYKPRILPVRKPWTRDGEPGQDSVTYMGVDAITKKWKREDTYGGKLVENVTQAIARDLLAYTMPRAEAAGYPIVLHVHDEILSETDENFGSVKEFEDIMGVLPAWAKGCPVKAEGWTGMRYKK